MKTMITVLVLMASSMAQAESSRKAENTAYFKTQACRVYSQTQNNLGPKTISDIKYVLQADGSYKAVPHIYPNQGLLNGTQQMQQICRGSQAADILTTAQALLAIANNITDAETQAAYLQVIDQGMNLAAQTLLER